MHQDNKIDNTMKMFRVFTDGGARGNPGPGAVGVVIYELSRPKEPVATVSAFIGDEVTNNSAEYQAVVTALRTLLPFQPTKVEFFLDSELVVKQLQGGYKIKQAHLQAFFQEIQALSKDIPMLEFNYIPREKNKEADRLVNDALDKVERPASR